MDEMVVMESLDLEDLQAGMARWRLKVRKVTWENRDLLDPGLEESLMSGGVELPAQTQQELNLSMLEELLELHMDKREEPVSTREASVPRIQTRCARSVSYTWC